MLRGVDQNIRSNIVQDDSPLKLDVRVIGRLSRECSNNGFTFFIAFPNEQPTRRPRKNEHAPNNQQTEHNLESNRESPSETGRTVRSTEVNPGRNQRTDSHRATLDTDQETTVG